MEDLCKNGIKKMGGGGGENLKKNKQKLIPSGEALKCTLGKLRFAHCVGGVTFLFFFLFFPSPFPLLLKQTGFCVGCWHSNPVVE